MTETPNILFIFSDQQHWQAVGFEDPSFQTPNLDRLASEGTVFKNSFCTTPQCSPSRSSIMTGLYPSKTCVLGNIGAAGGNPLQVQTIGAMLQEAGYHTAYFGKWHLGKDPVGTAGWDEDFGVTGPETTDDEEVTRRALDFVGRFGCTDKPFALFLSYNNPHDIYHFNRETDPAPRDPVSLPATWYDKDLATVPSVQQQFMREDQGKVIVNAEGPAWQRYRELYREKVELYDYEVGRVLTAFNDHGLLETTLVIATSDHGDMDGQHRLIYKGPFMYEHMMRVPLIIRPPASDHRLTATADLQTVNVDLVPTMADFAGVAIPETDGISLAPLINGHQNVSERSFVVGQYYSKQNWVNPIRMIRREHYKYNRYREHGEELYDMGQDPSELLNLASDTSYRDVRKELESTLDQWMRDNNDPFDSQTPTTRDGHALTTH
jgi:arylsulfatase A-like enzyme